MSYMNEREGFTAQTELDLQRDYVARQKAAGHDFSLVVADAFIRGIRDIGYKSTATALDELVDNSIQAGAQNVHVGFKYAAESEAKPSGIAIIDDGHGMDPEMIRLAIMWGGTHRENSRSGFGRYGYGLPSACVSQGTRFAVYSKPKAGAWHRVSLDLDKVKNGDYLDAKSGKLIVPEEEEVRLPRWVHEYLKDNFSIKSWDHGTIVVLEELDRIDWTSTRGLERNLLQHFGVIYRNFLNDVSITVNGKAAEPVDPLFTTEGCRYHDLDEDRAEPLPSAQFEVTDTKSDMPGVVRIRYAYLPPTFARIDKTSTRGRNNARMAIMKEYNKGIIVTRNGRQIDVIQTGCPWTTFVNNDRYWGVEVDFSAELDEEFSITTSKQQVVLSRRMWTLMENADVYKAIKQLRGRYKRERKEWENAINKGPGKRASEAVMQASEKFKTRKPIGDPVKRNEENRRLFEQEVKRQVRQTGQTESVVRKTLEEIVKSNPYRVEEENHPGAPFFRVAQLGGMKVLYLNTAHRFYTDVYSAPRATPYLQSALELLLFVIGDSELDASGDRRRFYEIERAEWSRMLSVALDQLSGITNLDDFIEALDATLEEEDDNKLAVQPIIAGTN